MKQTKLSSQVVPWLLWLSLVLGLHVTGFGQERSDITPNFTNMADQVGLSGYTPTAATEYGSGVVFADLNLDGYPDIYAIDRDESALYLNVASSEGERVFSRAVNDAGLIAGLGVVGAAPADYDNDGDLDLFVIRHDLSDLLFKNLFFSLLVLTAASIKLLDFFLHPLETIDERFRFGIALFDFRLHVTNFFFQPWRFGRIIRLVFRC